MIRIFHGRDERNFHAWALRGKATIKRRELIKSNGGINVNTLINKEEPSVRLPEPEDNRLQAVQGYELATELWKNVKKDTSGEPVTNKLTTIQNLLNIRYTRRGPIGDYSAMLKSQYTRLVAMQMALDESTKAAVLMTRPNEYSKY